MNSSSSMTIGVLAKEAGVGVETVRFYERKGLLRRPPKGPGYRLYSSDEARRIRFVKHAQTLGFTLREIKELLELRVSSKATCSEVKSRTDSKLEEIEGKLQDLQRMKSSLKRLSEACGVDSNSALECRILDCFETCEKC